MDNLFTSKFWIALRHPFSSQKRKAARKEISDAIEAERFKLFHQLAPQALLDLSATIKAYNKPVNMWLEFGTLLGAYRERGIIAHDSDLDVGIDERDFTPEFIQHLMKYGFKPLRNYTIKSTDAAIDGFLAEYTFQYKDAVNIDFFVFKTVGPHKICFSFDVEEGLSVKSTLKKYHQHLRAIQIQLNDFGLVKSEFLGGTFLIPDNTAEHLAEVYGPDFMTPKAYSYENRIKDYEVLLDTDTLGKPKFFS
ncbi:LicD family protein [Neisseria wadsworthii]|uniref:Phosphocholine transferase n=1 Tax=Neisseria wadsworthii 9715 TaxID=1030841 RepID=G4CNN1_9NEIS|nr:LicD family protein [Neisseria wadsworthii]EGZ49379.1 phosphocholine transferase [Neisseria wadsworthii 9715]QMT36643.1 LicD family protein [Neisseria wadsworthii]